MTTTIIIIAVAVIAALVGFCIGTDAGAKSAWKRLDEMDFHKRANLPSPVDTLSRHVKIPHHYLTRYVRMDKECIPQVNDEIEVLEKEGFTVDDYDTDDGLITMTKGIYEPKADALTKEHVERLESMIARVEDEWGEYEDNLCDELLDFVRKSVNNQN